MTDDDLYRAIASELSQNAMDAALWTRCFAQCDGDADKARALYIRIRFAALKEGQASRAPLAVEPVTASDASQRRRAGLTRRLRETGRPSLYATLGVAPSSSDAQLSAAITAAAAAPSAAGAEMRYAIEVLGDPQKRERYDEKLWAQISDDQTEMPAGAVRRPLHATAATPAAPWHNGQRVVPMVLGTVLLLGFAYWGLGVYQEKNRHEAHAESLRLVAEAERRRLENEAANGESVATMRERELKLEQQQVELRRQAAEQGVSVQRYASTARIDAQRQEQDRRLDLQREAQRRAQLQEEERKAARLRTYWACMNSSLDKVNSAAAELRCASYR